MDFVVVRLTTHGHRFELPCYRDRIESYVQQGRSAPPVDFTRIILHPSVFSNCHKKEIATNAMLQGAFHTTSFVDIAPVILQFGDIVMNEKDRQEKKSEKRELTETVIRTTRLLLRNKFTGVEPEDADVREELKNAKSEAKVVDNVDAVLQAAFFASVIVKRDHLDCTRLPEKVHVVYDLRRDDEAWTNFLLDFDGLVISTKKILSINRDAKEEEEGERKPTASIDVYYDAYWAAHPNPRWSEILEKHTIETAKVPISDHDIVFFSQYEFDLPHPESQKDLDLQARLAALETIKGGDQSEKTVKSGAPKGKKGKGSSADNGSDDEGAAAVPESKFEAMTHKQLQELCKQYKLSIGGKKQDLVERLETYQETEKPRQKSK